MANTLNVSGALPTAYISIDREGFFRKEKELDARYEQQQEPQAHKVRDLNELRKNPFSGMNEISLSQVEKGLLHDIAGINEWSRQSTESFYKIYLASGDVDNINQFIDKITGTEPGFYSKDGGSTLGLTVDDRAHLIDKYV